MKIQLLLFAQAREIVGENQIEFQLTNEADVNGLLRELYNMFPDLSGLEIKVAVNGEYTENTRKLHVGDEVAIIPPISGG